MELERTYEMRQYPTGWKGSCLRPSCGKKYTSKRKAFYCSTKCRVAHHDAKSRLARELCAANGLDLSSAQG